MKKFLLLPAIICLFACNNVPHFSIDGKVQPSSGIVKVYLYSLNPKTTNIVDSTMLSEGGEFHFSVRSQHPDFYKVTLASKESLIVGKNGDHITITEAPGNRLVASGTPDVNLIEQINESRYASMERLERINTHYENRIALDPENKKSYMQQATDSIQKENAVMSLELISFAGNHLTDLAGFYAINLLDDGVYQNEIFQYSRKINGIFKGNPFVDAFLARQEKRSGLQPGKTAPQFSLVSLNETPVELNKYKGSYLFIDFWASWCIYCRDENPNLVNIFKRYKTKRLSILSISLDSDRTAWKNAIKSDKLTWDNAMEPKGFYGPTATLYGVESLPSSFLIDPEGKILATNLRGKHLVDFLSKVL